MSLHRNACPAQTANLAAEIDRLRSLVDHYRVEIAHRDGEIRRLRELLNESQLCEHPIPGVPGHVWAWDRAGDFGHCVPAHVETRVVWVCDGQPVRGEFVELDSTGGLCGTSVRPNPYHGPPAYMARECCLACLADVAGRLFP